MSIEHLRQDLAIVVNETLVDLSVRGVIRIAVLADEADDDPLVPERAIVAAVLEALTDDGNAYLADLMAETKRRVSNA